MMGDTDQRKAERDQEDQEYADADRGRIDLSRQQKFERDIDDAHAIARRKPPRTARAAVRRRNHGERNGENAGDGHIDAKHKGGGHRLTHLSVRAA